MASAVEKPWKTADANRCIVAPASADRAGAPDRADAAVGWKTFAVLATWRLGPQEPGILLVDIPREKRLDRQCMNGGKGCMNDVSHASTVLARVATDGKTARRLADALAEALDPGVTAIAAFEARDGTWTVETYFEHAPDEGAVRRLVGDLAGDAAREALVFERIAARDWVAASLEGLQPVEAGRFFLHGAHHRARVPVNRIGIEIEAALAFGTGHHGTTRGCLLALDQIVKARHRAPRCSMPGAAPLLPRPAIGVRRPVHARERQRLVHSRKLRLAARPPHPAREGTPASPRTRGEVRTATASARILDVGTGTGVLAIAAARTLRG